MIEIQNMKAGILLSPQLKDNGDFAGNTYIDTFGFSHLRVMFIVGTVDAAIGSTAEGTALKIVFVNSLFIVFSILPSSVQPYY